MTTNFKPEQVSEGTTWPSGWGFTNITHYVACSKCGAPAGSYCATPKGRTVREPHVERCELFYKTQPPEIRDAHVHNGRAMSFTDFVSGGVMVPLTVASDFITPDIRDIAAEIEGAVDFLRDVLGEDDPIFSDEKGQK